MHLVQAAFLVVGQSVVLAFLRGALANYAPYPAALLARQLRAPLELIHFHRRVLRLQIGQAYQRKRYKLACLRAQGGELVVQVFGRTLVNRRHGFDPFGIQRSHRLRSNFQPVVLHAQARAQPSCLCWHIAGLDQFLGSISAGFVRFALGQPELLQLFCDISAASQVVAPQGIALDRPIVGHAVQRQLGTESGPFPVAA